MLSSRQRDAVFDGIPYVLAGNTCTKVLGRQYIRENNEVLPSITVTYQTESVRARWKGTEIRSSWNDITQEYDCKEGLIEKAIVGLTISSMDYSLTMDMAADLLMQLYRDRLNLDWGDIRVKFILVPSAPIMDSYRYEQGRGLVFRAHIDVWIEYEVSWDVIAPAIKSVAVHEKTGNITTNDLAPIELVLYAPGLYGMSMAIVGDHQCWQIDMIIEALSKDKAFNIDMKMYYTDVETSCEMGLTLI